MLQQTYSYPIENIQSQSMTILFGLDDEERHILAELGYRAKSFVSYLGKTLTARIQEFVRLNTGYSYNSEDMQLFLQDWFLQLFQCREEKFIGFQEYFAPIPVNFIIIGIDIILAYGHKVIQFSINPQKSAEAFYKALAIKIANDQLQTQVEDAHYYSEIILLD
jgi:hypothetical protein